MSQKGIPHRRWSKEEKLRIIRLHLDEHISVEKIEKEHGISHSLVSAWVKKYLEEGEEAFARMEDLYRRDELQGLSIFRQGKTEEALQKFLALLGQKGLPPEKKAALLLLAGDCYQKVGKPGEALGYYQRVYVMYQGEKQAAKEAYAKSIGCFKALGRTNDWLLTEKEAKERGYL